MLLRIANIVNPLPEITVGTEWRVPLPTAVLLIRRGPNPFILAFHELLHQAKVVHFRFLNATPCQANLVVLCQEHLDAVRLRD